MSGELEQGAAHLAEVVAYQEGSVVSRTLLKKSTGSVTAFAFDAGEGLSEHTAAFEALIFMIEGETEISVAGSWHRLSGGDMLRLPAKQPHAVKAVSRFKMLLVMLKD